MTTETTVRRVLVPEDRRLAVTAERFGVWFPMRLEPVVFSFAERLSKDSNEGHGVLDADQRRALHVSDPDAFADICNVQYYWLRDYMFGHPEA
jgi:hypothetical protein